MIIDKLKNAESYYSLGQNFKKAFEFLKKNDISNLKNGKYEIQGDEIFVSIQDYTTKPIKEGCWEAHRIYADIQYIIEGTEQLGYADTNELQPSCDYDCDKDIVFLQGDGQFTKAKAGDFLIFFPQDAHMPCISIDEPQYVKKAVVKIKL